MADESESDQEVQNGKVSRRAVLGGGGSSLLALSGVKFGAGVLDDADMVEIPKGVTGDEVIVTKKVPKKWWRHVQQARSKAKKLTKSDKHDVPFALTAGRDEIAGKNRVALVVSGGPHIADKDVPGVAEGLPVHKRIKDYSPACSHTEAMDYYNGGQATGATDGLCNIESVGTVTTPCNFDENNKQYFLTARHVANPGNSCSSLKGELVHNGSDHAPRCDYKQVGKVTKHSQVDSDWSLIDTYENVAPIGNEIWKGNISNNDIIRATNIEDDIVNNATYYQQGITTGLTEGDITHKGPVKAQFGCADYNNVEAIEWQQDDGTGVFKGDSGGPIFKEKTFGGTNYYMVAGMLNGKSTPTRNSFKINCTVWDDLKSGSPPYTRTYEADAIGTSMEHIVNYFDNQNLTFRFGRN